MIGKKRRRKEDHRGWGRNERRGDQKGRGKEKEKEEEGERRWRE